jgi:glycerol kinase
MDYLLSIDQGTSGTKAIIIDREGKLIARGYSELFSTYPQDGFVEQDPEDIYSNVLASVKDCIKEFNAKDDAGKIRACGISNQRETFLLWDRDGNPLHNALVWQCKRSVGICSDLKKAGREDLIHKKTGLIIDPYFSGTKLAWLLQNNETIKSAAKNGNACFGTIDSWILYRLTGGRKYKTDITNASRTLLYNIHTLSWDDELKQLLGAESLHFPEVEYSSSRFGETDFEGLLSRPVPINAMIGDSHSAAFGEKCFSAGSAKATLGTGSSFLMNVGTTPIESKNGMVGTICYSLRDEVFYALEGIIVSCGAPIKWLKDNLGLIASSSETEAMAMEIDDTGGVHLIPAFSGMGAPYWKMDARGAITGLTFGSDKRHIVRAALDSIAFQIKDIVNAMEQDSGTRVTQLSFDGGITSNGYVMKSIADLLGIAIKTISIDDVSAIGAALLAGLGIGLYKNTEEIEQLSFAEQTISPQNENVSGMENYRAWKEEVRKIL